MAWGKAAMRVREGGRRVLSSCACPCVCERRMEKRRDMRGGRGEKCLPLNHNAKHLVLADIFYCARPGSSFPLFGRHI